MFGNSASRHNSGYLWKAYKYRDEEIISKLTFDLEEGLKIRCQKVTVKIVHLFEPKPIIPIFVAPWKIGNI